MAEIKMPHPAHEEHLCLLQNVGYLSSNLEGYKKLVKEGRSFARLRSRCSKREEPLCSGKVVIKPAAFTPVSTGEIDEHQRDLYLNE
ncbi:MAG TPA: hypothetical protein VEP29_06300, partial [Desulfatiglandales bacterium]|nr:hypothetical protein [Desulfatiglandales bacterium]